MQPHREPGQAPPPAQLPEPGLRVRYLFAMWSACQGWEAKGAVIRLAAGKLRRRFTTPR
jgi:hypothetical protein